MSLLLRASVAVLALGILLGTSALRVPANSEEDRGEQIQNQRIEDYKLPRTVKTCKKNTPDYTSCLRLAIQESWLTFMKGIPELGLPILDPYTEEYFEHSFENGDVMGRVVVTDLKIYGLAKTSILAVRPKHEENRFSMEMDVEIPKSLFEGDYKAEGSVGPYKLGGKGYFNFSMEAITATWALDGRLEDDKWILEHFIVDQDIGKFKFYVDDIFNGNIELTRAVVKFVNENWIIFYKASLPQIIEYLDENLTKFANEMLFSKISFSQLFP